MGAARVKIILRAILGLSRAACSTKDPVASWVKPLATAEEESQHNFLKHIATKGGRQPTVEEGAKVEFCNQGAPEWLQEVWELLAQLVRARVSGGRTPQLATIWDHVPSPESARPLWPNRSWVRLGG